MRTSDVEKQKGFAPSFHITVIRYLNVNNTDYFWVMNTMYQSQTIVYNRTSFTYDNGLIWKVILDDIHIYTHAS